MSRHLSQSVTVGTFDALIATGPSDHAPLAIDLDQSFPDLAWASRSASPGAPERTAGRNVSWSRDMVQIRVDHRQCFNSAEMLRYEPRPC